MFSNQRLHRAIHTDRQGSRSRGSMIALIAALALVIIMIGIGFFCIMMGLGGSSSLQSAVDAGALNVSKDVLKRAHVGLHDENPDEMQFRDLASPADPDDTSSRHPSSGNKQPGDAGNSAGNLGNGAGSGTSNGQSGNGDGSPDRSKTDTTGDPTGSANNSSSSNKNSSAGGSNSGASGGGGNGHEGVGTSPGPTAGNNQGSNAAPSADGNPDLQIDVSNINKVATRALMIGMNEEGMDAKDVSTPEAKQHSSGVIKAANEVNNRLAQVVKSEDKLKGLFLQTAKANTIKTLGDAEIQPRGGSWKTTCVNVGYPSEIKLKKCQIPDGFDPSHIRFTNMPGKSQELLAGYQSNQLNLGEVELIPLNPTEQPHLISKTTFHAAENGKPTDGTPALKPRKDGQKRLPNAFSMSGEAKVKAYTLSAVSCALTQTVKQPVPAEISHGFIRIRIKPNRQQFQVTGEKPHKGWYNQVPRDYVYWNIDGVVLLEATLGNELGNAQPTLKDVLFPNTTGGDGYDSLRKTMVQRACEIDGEFTEADLDNLLSKQVAEDFEQPAKNLLLLKEFSKIRYNNFYLTTPQEQVYYLLKPKEGDKIVLLRDSEVLGKAPWMARYMSTQADGATKQAVKQSMGNGRSQINYKSKHVRSFNIQVSQTEDLQLSTGYDGLLGEITEERQAFVMISVR